MTLRLWLVEERELARQFSRTPPGRKPNFVWIPRSVTSRLLKFKEVPGQWRECEIEMEDWFAREKGLGHAPLD